MKSDVMNFTYRCWSSFSDQEEEIPKLFYYMNDGMEKTGEFIKKVINQNLFIPKDVMILRKTT